MQAAHMPHAAWQTVMFIALMLLLQLSAAFARYLCAHLWPGAGSSCAGLFFTALPAAGIVLFALAVQGRSAGSLGFFRRGAVRNYLRGFATGFAMFAAVTALCLLCGAVRFGGWQCLRPWTLLPWLAGFAVQGMQEEIALRGFLLTGLAVRTTLPAAVLTSSVVFAALHLFNPGISALALFNLALYGIFAALYFLRTDNIWGVGALHSAWNFTQGNLAGMAVSGIDAGASAAVFTPAGCDAVSGGAFGAEGGLAVTAVLTAAAVAEILLLKRKTLRPENSSL